MEKCLQAGQGFLVAKLAWLLVGGLLLLGVSPAWAEAAPSEAPQSPSLTSTDLNAADIPAEKIDQFVSAYLQVVDLIEERSEDLQRAETEADSLRLQKAIQVAAFQLIEASGLTRSDYWQLLGLANTDPEFRDRVLAQLEERDRP
ncbi:MAG: DUF4168 domain-containing protein [Leptolyngbya sp. SIO1D8]|nr:DUF4168 domain-containing protein [Leptolyngbya sp. SIO1D8]